MSEKSKVEKYRWANGHLYVLDESGRNYTHCFHNARIKGKEQAIKVYEEALMNDPFGE
jgi:hypothetical protein